MDTLLNLTPEQKQIQENISNLHPDNPIVFEMQKRFRELEALKV